MGLCQSGPPKLTKNQIAAKKASQALDVEMEDNYERESAIKKLLLLGAGESGKSTLFKQVNTLYGEGFKAEDTEMYRGVIHNNTIGSIRSLVHALDDHADGMSVACQDIADEVGDMRGGETIDPSLAAKIATLWKDPAIQRVYVNRNNFQLLDSAKYFLDNVQKMGTDNWLPDTQDMLRARIRTTGIIEMKFEIQANKFKMFDVGGQRNERKKWMHCFEEVTAVLFVGVLSEYNQVLFEDHTTNRMAETLNLFNSIVNSKWFKKTAMILFLNKRDLFQEKIEHHKLSKALVFRQKKWNVRIKPAPAEDEEYTDEEIQQLYPDIDTYQGGSVAIEQMFTMRNTENPGKAIYTHCTCATDSNNIQVVMDTVKDIILNNGVDEIQL